MRRVLLVFLCAFAAQAAVSSAPATPQTDSRGIKWVAASHVHSIRGADVYSAYCAVCPGATGRGDGRAASRLSVAVPDLSRITERDGRYVAWHVRDHVAGTPKPYVGMPNWREIFSANYPSRTFADIAMYNLAAHIETLQVANETRQAR